jgi:hypothetical protein
MQRQTQGQAADAATDDQDVVHVSSPHPLLVALAR